MIKDIKELNFPAYATLETASATMADMGDRTITSQVKIDGDVVPDFSYDWEVEFKGERYIHPVKTPQGTKDNTSRKSKIDLVFQHWAIYEMKRQYFVEMASTTAGTAIADKYIASLGLNLGDFITAFNLVLNHYFGGRIIINLNPEWQYDAEAKFVSISYSYIWDVLQQMHEIYGVRWTLKTNAEGVCEILMGYPAEEVSHIFEYGFEGGLLSVQRQVQSTEIRNRLLGRGGEKNLPYRYFKDKDPNNPLFEADPDWIPELANIAFTELRGKTFRDYVRGWKAKRYGGTVMTEPTEAYLAGYNAEKFDPIEYVDDKESIEKYGVLVGALENNEGIYPSIQGAPGEVDMIVDAEQVTDDDVDAAVENDSVKTNLESGHQTYRNAPANSTVTIETLTKRYFSVPEGKVGNLDMSLTVTGKYSDFGNYEETHPILGGYTITIHDIATDNVVLSSSQLPVVKIPSGNYYYMISADVDTNYGRESMINLNIESVHLYVFTPDNQEGWRATFDIWVRNIWNTSRNAGESDKEYADRVWLPILGDRTGDEARVVFASGWLSFSSDWEFPIIGYAFDDSKAGSEWRLTLAKSEAELEASGKHIPYEGYNASAGDRFFFIGIDMPHQYVLWGEERVDDYKRDALLETAEINPAWVIKTDKVRLNQDRGESKLIDSLSIGAQIRLANKQFIPGAYESLYVQSMTYNWTANTILYPDVEVVVSDKVHTVKNPVAQMQGSIETIQRQIGSLSNIQQIIRQVCDQLYLRKDGVEDLSKSPTKFLGKVTGEKFRQGQIGGKDWGIYRDENGNAIFEADKLVARQGILVSDLVVNEATYVGGLQINSAAAMKVSEIEDVDAGYLCRFDQKQGSVTNKFKVGDIALCQKFDADETEAKFYKRRVIAVTQASVTLSKIEVNGTGVPAEGDEIIHYGSYTDKTRQFVIIRDVIGGGYERMLMGLDSVNSDGVEYYFAGKTADSKARWFVGDSQQYAKYENGQLTIKGNLFVTGSDETINQQLDQLEFIRKAFGDGAQGLILGTAIIVGYNDANGKFVPMAGLSGVFNKDSENGGPAAWYGGTAENAKSMIFMDGTGYFADGLFSWDKDNGINLGHDQIKINYDGSIEFGGDIRIGNTGEETLDSLLTIVAGFAQMWKIDKDGNLVTDSKVVIKNSLIVEEDMSTGGAGSSGTIGISGVLVDGKEYRDVNADGLVDLSDAFKNVSVNLDNYYTKEEVYNKQETYSKNEVNELVRGGESDMFAWADEAKTTIKTEKNLIVEGELSDGGVGSNVTVGVTGIVIDGQTYLDADRDGLIDLTQALEGLDVDLSDYYTRGEVNGLITDVETKIDVVDEKVIALKGEWDTFRSVVYVDNNGVVHVNADLVVTGDQSTMAVSGEGGSGGYANLGIAVGTEIPEYPNTAGIITLSKELITSGIGLGELAFKDVADLSSDYLPKAGGEISGDLEVVGYLESDKSRIRLGTRYLFVTDANLWRVTDADWQHEYTLLHSGNIKDTNISLQTGRYTYLGSTKDAVDSATDPNVLGYSSVYDDFVFADTKFYSSVSASSNRTQMLYGYNDDVIKFRRYNNGIWHDTKTIAFTDSDITGSAAKLNGKESSEYFSRLGYTNSAAYNADTYDKFGLTRLGWSEVENDVSESWPFIYGYLANYWNADNDRRGFQLFAVAMSNGLYFRQHWGSWASWREVAFTDSDITGYAAGLKHANGPVGAIVNSSGNVTIGDSDLAKSNYRLYVNGSVATQHIANIGNNVYNIGSPTSIFANVYADNLFLGNSGIYLRSDGIISAHDSGAWKSNIMKMDVDTGNVGIGTTDPKERLHIDGSARANQIKIIDKADTFYPLTIYNDWYGDTGVKYSLIQLLSRTNNARGGFIRVGIEGVYGRFHSMSFGSVDTSYVTTLHLNASGYVGIGTESPQYKLDVAGTGRFTGAVTMSSTLSVSGDTTINSNLVVSGDMSDGGVGEVTIVAGVTEIYINGDYYYDNGYGTIDLSDAFAGLNATVAWTDIEGRPMYLSEFTNDLGLGNLAYEDSLSKSDVGLGNVTNLAASGYLTALSSNTTNAVSITVGGTTKSITVTTMRASLGLGSLAYKSSLVASDIPDLSNYYLGIDGGTIDGNLTVDGTINGYTLGSACSYNVTTSVTSGSSNLVTSGAVYSAFSLFPSNVAVKNDYRLAFKKTSANGGERWIYIASNNEFTIGYSTNSSALTTRVYGSPILFHVGGTYTTTNLAMRIAPEGNVEINNNLIVKGDQSTGSDIRFKCAMESKVLDIRDIAEAPLFTFKWNNRDDEKVYLGSSAQYWECVAPWLVSGEDFKTLNYATLGVAMGISLAKKTVNHEERIKELERKVESLETENRRLRYGN